MKTSIWPSAHLRIVILSAAFAFAGGFAQPGCDASTSTEKSPILAHGVQQDKEPAGNAAGVCAEALRAYALIDGTWQPRCFDAAIPRAASRWASDGKRIVALENARCSPTPEPVTVWLSDGLGWQRLTAPHSSLVYGDAGGLALLDDHIVLLNSERCITGSALAMATILATDGTLVDRVESARALLPGTIQRGKDLLIVEGFSISTSAFDVRDAPGVLLDGDAMCWRLSSSKGTGEFERCAASGGWPPFPSVARESLLDPRIARALTWTYDAARDRLVRIGVIQSLDVEVLAAQPQRWEVMPAAFSAPWKKKLEELPMPPVLGDGVTLLYDPAAEEVWLVDPFGERSYKLASDDSAWTPLEHAPIPVMLPDDLPARTFVPATDQQPAMRMTQWLQPLFVYWDTGPGAPVAIPYDRSDSLCMQVDGFDDVYACPKAHP